MTHLGFDFPSANAYFPRMKWNHGLAVCCALLLLGTRAVSGQTHNADGQFLRDWLVLGPFPASDIERDFLAGVGGESAAEPRAGDAVTSDAGDTLRWRRYQTPASIVDFDHVFGRRDPAAAYAFCTLVSETEQPARFLLGSRGDVAVWLNGRQVYDRRVRRRLTVDDDTVRVTLQRGVSTCLVKVVRRDRRWQLAMRIEPAEKPVPVTPVVGLWRENLSRPADVVLLDRNWKYAAGDRTQWAAPDFDDATWETASTRLTKKTLPKSGWKGLGWFRLHLVVDSTLSTRPLALLFSQAGASEVYLDGQLLYRFGTVGRSKAEERAFLPRQPKIISFTGKREHVLAVRYSNFNAGRLLELDELTGFVLALGDADFRIAATLRTVETSRGYQMFFVGVPLAFTVLHLLLFLFYRQVRSNLFYALFTGSLTLLTFTVFQSDLATSFQARIWLLQVQAGVVILMVLFGLTFQYSLFYEKPPRLSALFLVPAGGLVFYYAWNPVARPEPLFAFVSLGFVEMIRVLGSAILKKREGAWIIALGFLIFIVFATYQMLLVIGVMPGTEQRNFAFWYGILALLVCMSAYLARNFARTQMENARKTQELAEARKLQLSMLPQAVPQLPNLDIAVYMKPATEVGGDYYDFHLSNGTLTVAIGDATGHGMKAGTMVATTKGLFKMTAEENNLPQVFKQISGTLKSMNLGLMYMSLTLLKLQDNRARLCAAGMPPAFRYRESNGSVEEIVLKSLPLGGFPNFPYQVCEFDLEPGDAIILMSDGFPEMLNPAGEILDYPGAQRVVEAVAHEAPQRVIEQLVQAGRDWAAGRPQEDDVTFVVLKVKR